MATSKPLLYIAGPYTKPEPIVNIHVACKVGSYFADQGFDVHVPHCNMVWHLVAPHREQFWYDMDLAILRRVDAVYRILGYSVGADGEEALARQLGIPVFYAEKDLLAWRDGLA